MSWICWKQCSSLHDMFINTSRSQLKKIEYTLNRNKKRKIRNSMDTMETILITENKDQVSHSFVTY